MNVRGGDEAARNGRGETQRLEALARYDLLDTPPEEAFDRVTRLVRRLVGAPIALVSLVERERQFLKSTAGLPEPLASRRETPLSHSFCKHVAASGEKLVVTDARAHPLVCDNGAVDDFGVIAYLGVPLRAPTGEVLGSLCAIDGEPHDWTDEDERGLEELSAVLTTELALRLKVRELQAAQREQAASRALLDASLDALTDLFFVVDLEGRLFRWNRCVREVTGYADDELAGMAAVSFFDDDDARRVVAALGRVRRDGWATLGAYVVARDGRRTPYELNGSPLRDESGRVVGICGIGRDLTERLEADRAVREGEERLQIALKAGRMGTWDWGLQSDTLYWSPQTYALFGLSPDAFGSGKPAFYDLVHADDRERVHVASRRVACEGGGFDVEYRIRRPDGTLRWMNSRGQLLRDVDGRPARIIGTVADITERKVHEEALRKAKREAEEIARAKSALLNNMSHEIRTPLTTIIGFADLLVEEVPGPHREMIGMIHDGGRRLLDTLNSVLDLAQIEGGTLELKPERLDVADEACKVLRLFGPRADAKGLTLACEAAEPVWVETDRPALRRVLTNLVGNAVKFTPKGRVTVHVDVAPGAGGTAREAVVHIVDTGVGVDPAFVPRMFAEFQQESSGLAREHEGSGLGLAIVRRLVGLMGGRVAVESEKGAGTTFRVYLPLAPSAPAAATDEAPPRVLVVDDTAETRLLLRAMLAPTWQVDDAATAEGALALAERTDYDAVLLDVRLGGALSGVDVLYALREQAAYAATPVLAVTAQALPGDEEELLAAGFDGYLAKPFRKQALLAALAEVLDASREDAP